MDLKRKEQYEAIRHSVMNDATLKDNPSRLVSFMEQYIEHIKNEPAIMEWEMNLWERDIREIFVFIFSCLLFFTISGYIFSDNKETQEVIRNLGVFLICMQSFFLAMSLSPERYYHKITSTGIYVYSYKRGKAYREKLVMGLLVVGGIAAVVLLFILGPMAFAGAGAGTLGLFSLAAMAKDKPPKEFALPWEAIFAIEVDEHNGLFKKKKIFSVQLQVDVVCDAKNYSEVRNILDHYKMECTQYIKPGRKNRQTAEFEKLMEESEKEIEFVWYFHPRNRYGE
ncbi:hypothetical protein MHO82_22385 [Vibrio sp. Of7-15]|uniref:hypothetical protein n=1 Tax=Vibrio sp. Of7-15 TaxID=2724879 RepID=UPI001EF37C04|nr:hypothetical protein [Vibrio sp. Of7-15]MCG7499617.1 hypothetical protein [Vibrio sp. Of7-15]